MRSEPDRATIEEAASSFSSLRPSTLRLSTLHLRVALPGSKLGAGCSKDSLGQDIPATMKKRPLHHT
jgi:hypothetical protein